MTTHRGSHNQTADFRWSVHGVAKPQIGMPEHALEGVRVALVGIDLEIVVGRTGSAVLAGNHGSRNDSSAAYLLRGEYVSGPGAVADFSSKRRLGVLEYLGK